MFKFLIIDLKFPNTARCVAAVSTVTSILAIFIARPNPDFGTRAPERWSFSVFVDWKAFKNAGYAWFCAAICWMFFGFYAVFFNLEEWAADRGIVRFDTAHVKKKTNTNKMYRDTRTRSKARPARIEISDTRRSLTMPYGHSSSWLP